MSAARVAADDEALTRLGRSLGDLGSEHVARAAVEAAAPLIEAAVREQIAQAIEVDDFGDLNGGADFGCGWRGAGTRAARIARGEV
jgi:hypothetical protein